MHTHTALVYAGHAVAVAIDNTSVTYACLQNGEALQSRFNYDGVQLVKNVRDHAERS